MALSIQVLVWYANGHRETLVRVCVCVCACACACGARAHVRACACACARGDDESVAACHDIRLLVALFEVPNANGALRWDRGKGGCRPAQYSACGANVPCR